MMASTVPPQTNTDIKTLLHCSLCKGELKEPRLLSCQHSFCTKCLEEMLATLQEGEQLKCPTCEKVVDFKNDDVTSIPENFLYGILKENIGFGDGDLECFSCKTVPTKSSSTHMCLDCSDPLCTNCKEWHCRTSATTHHLVVSIEDMKEKKFQDEWVRRKQIKCKKHGIPLKFYCEDCESLVCNDCFVFEHKQHTCKNWNEASDKRRPIMEASIGEIFITHNERVSKAKGDLEEVQQDHDKQKNDICKQATEIHDLVDKIKEAKLEELENHYEKEIEEINKKMQKESKQESEIDATKTFANIFFDHSSDVEFLQHEKEVEKMLLKYKQRERKSFNMKLLPTRSEDIDTLRDGIRRVFGEITVCNETILQNRRLGEVRELFKYQVEDGIDVNGLAVDDDGNVLVACDSMRKILVLTSGGKHKRWIECEQLSNPWDVFVKGDDIYVTDYAQYERKLIVMNHEGKVKKILKLPAYEQRLDQALCMIVNDEGRVIISSAASDRIYISDPCHTSFLPYITKEDQADMKCTLYLHITTRKELVFCKEKFAAAYNENRELQWKYKGQQGENLQVGAGTCGDKAGNVYIADFSNPRIHIVNNGKPVGCIELGGDADGVRPLAITKHDELIYAYDNKIVKIAFWE